MCLAIPGKVISISGDDALTRMGKIDFSGVIKHRIIGPIKYPAIPLILKFYNLSRCYGLCRLLPPVVRYLGMGVIERPKARSHQLTGVFSGTPRRIRIDGQYHAVRVNEIGGVVDTVQKRTRRLLAGTESFFGIVTVFYFHKNRAQDHDET